MAFNILLHQRAQALLDASPRLSQVEKESLRTAPFGSLSPFDDLLTKLHLLEKVVGRQRENALYRASAHFPVSRHSHMQRMGVQSSGNPIPSTFQGVCSHDMYPFTICGQGPPLEEEGIISLSPQNERNDAIKITCNASSPGFYSRLFLVAKTSGGWRPVINLSLLNTFLEIPHFIDLIDAYFHIIIHQDYRKFLWFQTRDTFYQFKVLPFDLSPAPWVFTKVMVEIKVLVHGMGSNYVSTWTAG